MCKWYKDPAKEKAWQKKQSAEKKKSQLTAAKNDVSSHTENTSNQEYPQGFPPMHQPNFVPGPFPHFPAGRPPFPPWAVGIPGHMGPHPVMIPPPMAFQCPPGPRHFPPPWGPPVAGVPLYLPGPPPGVPHPPPVHPMAGDWQLPVNPAQSSTVVSEATVISAQSSVQVVSTAEVDSPQPNVAVSTASGSATGKSPDEMKHILATNEALISNMKMQMQGMMETIKSGRKKVRHNGELLLL